MVLTHSLHSHAEHPPSHTRQCSGQSIHLYLMASHPARELPVVHISHALRRPPKLCLSPLGVGLIELVLPNDKRREEYRKQIDSRNAATRSLYEALLKAIDKE